MTSYDLPTREPCFYTAYRKDCGWFACKSAIFDTVPITRKSVTTLSICGGLILLKINTRHGKAAIFLLIHIECRHTPKYNI